MRLAKIALLSVGAVGFLYMSGIYSHKLEGSARPPEAAAAPAQADSRLPPTIQWEPIDHSYSVLRGSFTIVNPNSVPIKDIVLHCNISAASGTIIRRERYVVYQAVPANGKRRVKDFTFGFWPSQGADLACRADLS